MLLVIMLFISMGKVYSTVYARQVYICYRERLIKYVVFDFEIKLIL